MTTYKTDADIPAVWEVGDVILDELEVREVLGRGGMGVVYLVYHRGFKVELAVKCAKAEIFADEKGKRRFVREATNWVQLPLHPHVVTCHYVRMMGGIPRIFAEYVEGGSLQDWIEERTLYEGGHDVALERMLDVAIQFAWGLHYAHEEGLVHQDIKPGNVMMMPAQPNPIAKVTDFGLAKAREVAADGKTMPVLATHMGTLCYQSPEQSRGKGLTRKTDMWSWGISILQMFMGDVTWLQGSAADDVLEEDYLDEGPQCDDAHLLPPMPEGLVQLLEACFERKVKKRPATMQVIAQRLIAIYEQEMGHPYFRRPPTPATAFADNLNNRAVSLAELGDMEEAMQLWQAAIHENPQHIEAIYNFELARWRQGEINDDALVLRLKDVCNSFPAQWLPKYLLAQVHLERWDITNAITLLEAAAQLAPDQVSIQTALNRARADDVPTARCLHILEGHTSRVNSVALSADGKRGFSTSNKRVKVWDLTSGHCLHTLKDTDKVAFSANGEWALSSSDKTVKIWDLNSGHCLHTREHIADITSIAISANGERGLSSSGKMIKVWDMDSGHCLHTLEGHTHSVSSVALSADGKQALSGSKDNTLKLWDLTDGCCLRTLTLEEHTYYYYNVRTVGFSANGERGLSISSRSIKVWDLDSGHCLHTLEKSMSNLYSPMFSDNGNRLIYYRSSGYSMSDFVTVYDFASNGGLRTLEEPPLETSSVALSGNGRWALSASENLVRVWDFASGRCMHTIEVHRSDYIESVALSTNGCKALISSTQRDSKDKMIEVWALPCKHMVCRDWQLANLWSYSRWRMMEQASKGWQQVSKENLRQKHFIAALTLLQQARKNPQWIWNRTNLEGWQQLYAISRRMRLRAAWLARTLKGHKDWVTSVALSSDGRWALSGSQDGMVKLWDLANLGDARCVRTLDGHTYWVESVALSLDGRFALSSSGDNMVKVWDLADGRCLHILEGHTDHVASATLSPDGRYVLSGSKDNTIRLWELTSAHCLHTLKGHYWDVTSVAFSSDGRYAFSGSEDCKVKLWDLANGCCIRTFKGHTGYVYSVALSPDGRWGLSGSRDETLKLWNLVDGGCLRTLKGHTHDVTSVALSPDGRWALSGSWDKTLKLWNLADGGCVRTLEGHTNAVESVALSADGRVAISGSWDGTVKVWALDWELETFNEADWDEGARPYLVNFLTLHTPFVGTLPEGREPTEEEVRLALTRRGKPTWSEEDFQGLIRQLQYAGYGWLRPEGVRVRLLRMARVWREPPGLFGD